MIDIKDLTLKDLKMMHKGIRKKIDCAPEMKSNEDYSLICPGFNRVKVEGMIVLRMLEDEFISRGYDTEKLFKGYKKSDYGI